MRSLPWVLGLTALALALRLFRLGAWDIGLDEAYSALVAAHPVPDLVRFVAQDDFHPPLFYVLLHLWRTVAGTDEFWLRFPNAVLGSLAIPLVHALGRELVSDGTGLVGALLLAVSPVHVYHAQDLRMYPLLVLLGTAATRCFARAIRTSRITSWALHTTFLALALYTHYAAFLLVAGEALAVGWLRATRQPVPIRPWMASTGTALVVFLPWGSVLLHHLTRTVTPEGTGTITGIFQQVAYALVALTSDFLPPGQPLLKAGVLCVFGGAALWGVRALQDRPVSAAVLFSTSLGALGLAALFALRSPTISVGTHVLIPRTLLLASVGYLLLLATAMVRVQPRLVGSVLLCTLLALNAFSLPRVYFGPRPLWGPWRTVAAYVVERVQPGDGILVVSGHWARPFDFYYRPPVGSAHVLRYYGVHNLPDVHRLLTAAPRVWLVSKQPKAVDPTGRVRRLLDAFGHRTLHADFPSNVQVSLYVRAPHPSGSRR